MWCFRGTGRVIIVVVVVVVPAKHLHHVFHAVCGGNMHVRVATIPAKYLATRVCTAVPAKYLHCVFDAVSAGYVHVWGVRVRYINR